DPVEGRADEDGGCALDHVGRLAASTQSLADLDIWCVRLGGRHATPYAVSPHRGVLDVLAARAQQLLDHFHLGVGCPEDPDPISHFSSPFLGAGPYLANSCAASAARSNPAAD